MATDIDNTAEFSFNNMKPAADEEITALWGKNAADNTGFLFYREKTVGNSFAHYNNTDPLDTFGDTVMFTKNADHDTLTGTVINHYSANDAGASGTTRSQIRDLLTGGSTEFNTLLEVVDSGDNSGNTDYTAAGFTYDISHLVDGQIYLLENQRTFVIPSGNFSLSSSISYWTST